MSTPEGPEPRIDPELVQALVRYPFMANIRELEQFMWKALAQSTGKFVVLARELRGGPLTPAETPTPHAERLAVRELTADDIRRSLDAQGHNVASAAQALGLPSRYALYRLMRKFGIAVEPAPKADVDALDH
jgi:two-component system nitrogen regulation response regulator GlnG/two-component system response regulator HydG